MYESLRNCLSVRMYRLIRYQGDCIRAMHQFFNRRVSGIVGTRMCFWMNQPLGQGIFIIILLSKSHTMDV